MQSKAAGREKQKKKSKKKNFLCELRERASISCHPPFVFDASIFCGNSLSVFYVHSIIFSTYMNFRSFVKNEKCLGSTPPCLPVDGRDREGIVSFILFGWSFCCFLRFYCSATVMVITWLLWWFMGLPAQLLSSGCTTGIKWMSNVLHCLYGVYDDIIIIAL